MRNHFRLFGITGASLLALACSGQDNDGSRMDVGADVPGAEGAAAAPADIVELLLRNQADIEAIRDQYGQSRYTEQEVSALLASAGLTAPSSGELVRAFESRRSAVLAEAEERMIREALDTAGEELTFEGRVVYMGDIVLDADQLLDEIAKVPKAQVCIKTGDPEGCQGYVTSSYTQNDGDGKADTLSFRRPDVARTTYLVVPDSAVTFFNALLQETTRIEELNPPGDCLTSSSFVPIFKGDYDRLDGISRAIAFTVTTSIGAGLCGGAKGCASLPGNINVLVNPPGGGGELRTGFGQAGNRVLLINSTFFPTDNAQFRSTLRHELLHLMGRSHRISGGSSRVATVPGTNPAASSLMQVDSDVFRTTDFSTDDIKAIKTLYSDNPNRANDSCPWTTAFRSFTPLP